MTKLDDEGLRRLRSIVGALRRERGRSLGRTEMVKLASALAPGVSVTLDLEATETLGQALVVLRPSAAGTAPEFAELSPREREVAALLAEGLRNKEIASALHISVATVNPGYSPRREQRWLRVSWHVGLGGSEPAGVSHDTSRTAGPTRSA